jgi:hypothetical protein
MVRTQKVRLCRNNPLLLWIVLEKVLVGTDEIPARFFGVHYQILRLIAIYYYAQW